VSAEGAIEATLRRFIASNSNRHLAAWAAPLPYPTLGPVTPGDAYDNTSNDPEDRVEQEQAEAEDRG
jgi:hypothetical protein